jgi:hypothetical protein
VIVIEVKASNSTFSVLLQWIKFAYEIVKIASVVLQNRRELRDAAPNPARCRHRDNATWCQLDPIPRARPPLDPAACIVHWLVYCSVVQKILAHV